MSDDEMIDKYAGYACSIAREFYIQGADWDDLRQEALIGLWKGIRDFRPELGERYSFYALCVRRQLISAVKAAGREKHAILTGSLRHGVGEYGDFVPILEVLCDEHLDPAEIAEHNDLRRRLEDAIGCLSQLERRAINGHRVGLSYREMGGEEHDDKSIDNALQRARRRLTLAVAA